MGCRALLTTAALVATLGMTGAAGIAQTSSEDKVLAQKQGGFNPAAVRAAIASGDAAASRGDLAEARVNYDKAREASTLLLGFYRNLSGSFRGLDARIPREMDTKGRETQALLAETNLRLAALFRRQNQQQMAVPLLVEVIKLMTRPNPRLRRPIRACWNWASSKPNSGVHRLPANEPVCQHLSQSSFAQPPPWCSRCLLYTSPSPRDRG